ncbi:MAG: HesA/MoeB/ThiF family protein [Candidatus Thorarchaeota archaeon]|nr:HesA/MoeB/ThiF family protein [Candidatus Thorarchaeota archaeon]
MRLTDAQKERYSRMLALNGFTEDDMRSLLDAHVTVVGAGGLGSPALRMLTAMGFGLIRIIDRDVVELSNIQRQTVFNTRDIDRPKAEAAADNLALLNPDVQFDPVVASLDADNAERLLAGSDVIVDGLDSFTSRYAVNRASISLGIPYIYAGAIESYGNCTTFVPGVTGCFRCLVGELEDRPEQSCAAVGVSPDVLSLIASVEVREALLLSTHREPLLKGRLFAADMSTLTMETFAIGRDHNCPECSLSGPQTSPETGRASVTAMCSGAFCITPRERTTVNLEQLSERLRKKHRVQLMQESLSVFMDAPQKITVMRQGIAIARGFRTGDEALRKYFELFVDE